MSEARLEISRQLRTAQDKYAYFLLAAAGAALGFALSQTQRATLSWSQLPLAAAALSWGLSFVSGCFHLQCVGSALYANVNLLRVEAGEHPEIGNHPQRVAAASAGILSAIDNRSKRGGRYGQWQFWLLIAGAVFYIVWHVFEMWQRSVHIGPLP